jgi:hypothetical protein
VGGVTADNQGQPALGGDKAGRRFGQTAEFLGDDALGCDRDDAGQALHLLGHLRAVGQQAVDADDDGQPRKHRQHHVERLPAGVEPHIAAPHPCKRTAGHLEGLADQMGGIVFAPARLRHGRNLPP